MNYIQEINNYNTVIEQEIQDVKVIKDLIKLRADITKRDFEIAHLTSSSIILNKDLTKTLVHYHNIYDTWTWTGGHADGDTDMLKVAIKEAIEETGVTNVSPIFEDVQAIDILNVNNHIKKGKYVNDHLHLNYTYFLMANEQDILSIKKDENSGVKWMDINEFLNITEDTRMKDVFIKLFKKIEDIKEKNI